MLDIFIVQHHHHKRDRNAVIRSQRCAVCREHAVFQHQIDSLFCEIMLNSGAFVAYHINVALKHNRLFVLRALACAFFNDHIIAVILIYPQTSVFCKFYKKVADAFFIS